MDVPTVEASWVPDLPRKLVSVVLHVGDDEANARCGCGSTLAQAFERLADDIRRQAEIVDDNWMRAILGGE